MILKVQKYSKYIMIRMYIRMYLCTEREWESERERDARTHTHNTHTHARTHARTHAHTHTHTWNNHNMYVYMYIYCSQSAFEANKAWRVCRGRARKVRTDKCALTYRHTNCFAYLDLKVAGWLCSDTRQIPQCFTTFSNGTAQMIARRWYTYHRH